MNDHRHEVSGEEYDVRVPEESRPYVRPPVRSSAVNNWLVAILLILVAALLLRFTNGGRDLLHNPDAEPRAVTARGDLAADEKATIELFQEASPSVVFITTATTQSLLFESLKYTREVPKGTGSGFVWDKDGHIVTNFHVLQGSNRAEVTLQNQEVYRAALVGVAPEYDLAVLKIDAPADQLKPLAIGESDGLLVGQKTFAIGFPFGLDHTLTTGVVSGLNRVFRGPVADYSIKQGIQTNAAINPGNSGGPLLDSAGRLIGVNAAIYSDTGNFAGVGFAIPVNTVNEVVPDLIQDGKLSRPDLGISPLADNPVFYLVQQGVLPRPGVLFNEVAKGSPAAEAGLIETKVTEEQLLLGDLIIGIDGEEIRVQRDLERVLRQHFVGDTVTVTVLRKGEKKSVEVKLTGDE
ncbi:MAG: 2-alkenal reductase [Planctomyces sp.]|nr:2-alkenal reductase [Planctomyces sp.]